jgi:hypothetical protein
VHHGAPLSSQQVLLPLEGWLPQHLYGDVLLLGGGCRCTTPPVGGEVLWSGASGEVQMVCSLQPGSDPACRSREWGLRGAGVSSRTYGFVLQQADRLCSCELARVTFQGRGAEAHVCFM